MTQQTLDALARRASALQVQGQNRRTSLQALAAAALLGTGIAPLAAQAKSNAGKKAKKRCKKQVAPCRAALEPACDPGDPDCPGDVATCCQFLAQCNAGAAMHCVTDTFFV
jgi:hypothetical protein